MTGVGSRAALGASSGASQTGSSLSCEKALFGTATFPTIHAPAVQAPPAGLDDLVLNAAGA